MDLSLLMTPKNGLLVVLILAILQVAKTWFREAFQTRFMQRVTPTLPILLGFLLGFAKLADGPTRLRDHLVLGVVVGWAAANLFKVGRTTILGWGLPGADPVLAPLAASSPPTPPPVDSLDTPPPDPKL